MNLKNQKFGRLLVLEKDITKGDANHPYWICKCDCGTIKSIRQDVLRNGSTKSCGCYQKEVSRKRIIEKGIAGHNFQDLTGKQFHDLTVIKKHETRHTSKKAYSVIWECKCKCGNIIYVDGNNLKSGHTTSCGCRKESIGVIKIQKILKELKIEYEKEKTFSDCISDTGTRLRMDFYIPSLNTAIEIDGHQHFNTTPTGFYTQEKLDRIKFLDKLKNKYCEEHNIKIIRIPYTEWNIMDKNYILNLLRQ